MKFFPVPDRLIRNPVTLVPLPIDGIEVEPHHQSYIWFQRLLADGDVSDKPPLPVNPAVKSDGSDASTGSGVGPGIDPATRVFTADAAKPPSAGGPVQEQVK